MRVDVSGEEREHPFPFSFHFYVQSISLQLLGGGRPACCGTGAVSPILLPVLGLGMLSCSLSLAPGSAAAGREKKKRQQHLKSLKHSKE